MRQRARALSQYQVASFVESNGGIFVAGDKGLLDVNSVLKESRKFGRNTQVTLGAWVAQLGWTAVGNRFQRVAVASSTSVIQAVLTAKCTYALTYRVDSVSDGIMPYAGAYGTTRTTPGTYTDIITAASGALETTVGFTSLSKDTVCDITFISCVNLSVSGVVGVAGGALKPTPITLQNGNFEAATIAPWTADRSTCTLVTASPYSGTQNLRIAWSTGTTGYCYQPSVLVVGVRTIIRGMYRTDGLAVAGIAFGGGSTTTSLASPTNWTFFEWTAVTTTNTNLYLYATNMAAGRWVEFDNVTVEPVIAYQSTAANMPPMTVENGRNVLSFLGSTYPNKLLMNLTAGALKFLHDGTGGCITVVYNVLSTATDQTLWSSMTGSTVGVMCYSTGTSLAFGIGKSGGWNYTSGNIAGAYTTGLHVFQMIYSTANSPKVQCYVDGDLVASGADNTPSTADPAYVLGIGNGAATLTGTVNGRLHNFSILPIANVKECRRLAIAQAQMAGLNI